MSVESRVREAELPECAFPSLSSGTSSKSGPKNRPELVDEVNVAVVTALIDFSLLESNYQLTSPAPTRESPKFSHICGVVWFLVVDYI